jgi:hypothetical protein
MDLDKYIGENIDDILDNPYDFVDNKSDKKNQAKKVVFSEYNDVLNNSDNLDEDEKEYIDYNYEYYENLNQKDNSDEVSDDEQDENINIQYEKEPNEDNYLEDIMDELYHNMYEKNMDKSNIVDVFKNITQSDFLKNETINYCEDKLEKNNFENQMDNIDKETNELVNDDGYYFFNLINIFTKYYNNKYDKNENFFSGVTDLEKGTSNQMNYFFDAVIEYKMVKKHFEVDNDVCMKMIFNDIIDSEKILELFDKWKNQIYMLEFNTHRLISPSLLICLNYIYDNNLLQENLEWNIYNLRNFD